MLRYVIVGGFLGTLVRNSFAGTLLEILLINWFGCFCLGWLLKKTTISKSIKFGCGTGLIGSFTTFSTCCLQTIQTAEKGNLFIALIYIFCSAVGGITFTVFGMRCAGVKIRWRF